MALQDFPGVDLLLVGYLQPQLLVTVEPLLFVALPVRDCTERLGYDDFQESLGEGQELLEVLDGNVVTLSDLFLQLLDEVVVVVVLIPGLLRPLGVALISVRDQSGVNESGQHIQDCREQGGVV